MDCRVFRRRINYSGEHFESEARYVQQSVQCHDGDYSVADVDYDVDNTDFPVDSFDDDPLKTAELFKITGHEDETLFITDVVMENTQSLRVVKGTSFSLESTLLFNCYSEKFVMQTFSGR